MALAIAAVNFTVEFNVAVRAVLLWIEVQPVKKRPLVRPNKLAAHCNSVADFQRNALAHIRIVNGLHFSAVRKANNPFLVLKTVCIVRKKLHNNHSRAFNEVQATLALNSRYDLRVIRGACGAWLNTVVLLLLAFFRIVMFVAEVLIAVFIAVLEVAVALELHVVGFGERSERK